MRRAAIAVGLILGLVTTGSALRAAEPPLPIHDGVGGEFSAPSSLGRKLSLSELRGKAVLLFFGYTSCQDICPATLGHLKSMLKGLGPDAERVQVLLVTVDPENDTPENLKKYLASFDPGFIGISGTRAEIDGIAKLFMAKHDESHGVKLSTKHNRHKSPVGESYLYSHSQQIYLLDKQGRTRGLFFVGSPRDQMQQAIRTLLNEPDAPVEAEETQRTHRKAAHEHGDAMHEKEDAR